MPGRSYREAALSRAGGRCGVGRLRRPSGATVGRRRRLVRCGGAAGGLGQVLVLVAERQVDPHQGLALLLGEVLVGEDVPGQVGVAVGRSRMPAWT